MSFSSRFVFLLEAIIFFSWFTEGLGQRDRMGYTSHDSGVVCCVVVLLLVWWCCLLCFGVVGVSCCVLVLWCCVLALWVFPVVSWCCGVVMLLVVSIVRVVYCCCEYS